MVKGKTLGTEIHEALHLLKCTGILGLTTFRVSLLTSTGTSVMCVGPDSPFSPQEFR